MASERDPIPCPVCREVIIGPLSAAVHLSDMHGLSMYGALARLTRELEEARERERTVRSAVIRSVAALVRLDPRWDPREETEWVRRGPVVRTALRIKDDVLALATPPAEGGGEAGVTTTATHQDFLQVDDGD